MLIFLRSRTPALSLPFLALPPSERRRRQISKYNASQPAHISQTTDHRLLCWEAGISLHETYLFPTLNFIVNIFPIRVRADPKRQPKPFSPSKLIHQRILLEFQRKQAETRENSLSLQRLEFARMQQPRAALFTTVQIPKPRSRCCRCVNDTFRNP